MDNQATEEEREILHYLAIFFPYQLDIKVLIPDKP